MKPTAILIVEDEFILARDLALRLRDLGYAVAGTAATGADAVALVDRQRPDLVLMDIHLQGPLDGIVAAQEIRRRWRLPVVFLTAYADDDTLQRAKLAEPFGYILKPFEDRELRTLIEIALYKHQAEQEIRRLSELYATLSQINQAIVRIDTRPALLDEVCRVTARYGGFLLVWVGWIDPQTRRVHPVAQAGPAVGFLDGIVVYADDRPEGCGPVGTSLREGRSCIFNDYLHDPRSTPWRKAAHQYGLQAAVSIPIRFQGEVCAAFVVYAATPDVFQVQEMNLLEEAASDISFALDHLETERQRQLAEEKLRESEQRVRAKLDSLLCPEGDIGALELADIIDVPALQTTMDAFFKLTHIGMAILDLQGRVLVSTGWQDLCVKFHRVHPVTCQNCTESDTVLSRGVEPGTFKLYRCKNNMYDIVTPIVVGGQHLGNLFLGQLFFDDELPDRELFRAQANRYGFNEAEYLAALDLIPRWSRDQVNTVMTFYARFIQMLSTLSYSNIKLARSLAEQQRAEEHIIHLTYYDDLTQLPNRVLLTDRLQQAMAKTQRDQQKLAVCYLDLDDFKPINDAFGSIEGDRMLVEVARRLKTCVRAGDTVARLGGDEFVLLLGELSNVEECEHAMDRVLTALHEPFFAAGQPLSLTASLGVTWYPDDASDPDALLRHTDQAMYAAKQAGGHCYHWFDTDHDRRARAHRDLLQRVEAGLAAGEFRLYYQPKVDMRTGAVIGAEALIRWQHPDEGLLPPVRFMPAVEVSELSIVVDSWVIQEALRQMTVWAAHGLNLSVSVNVCGRHLQQPDFVARLQTLLALYPAIPRDGLELEILETAALDDVTAISRLIETCRQLGVRFALDDFGTGYSSLTYLQHLPVQLLKIDQSFVRNLLVDADAQAIVEGVIGLSAAFRREVIAEGVETAAHGCRLIQLGCVLGQGYGIARPMPPEQIPAWIAVWTPPGVWADPADPA
ncbi:MAG: EAL domain-containing protein [Candidatus Contendobacter sp.]|jgi:diguanylate cyclase (GGDEF)-like protein|nr:EAL domain-containing protein [Gammaproteobacteria bacterium]MCC8995262.1 EAL domain-containing protein [Candidatus Contendobacter sp.]